MGAVESAVKKVREGRPSDLDCFLSAFPTQLLFRQRIVKGVSGNALDRPEYIGFAPCDAHLTDPVWQIKKLIYDSTGFNTDVLFANGNAQFDKIMSNAASLTYTTT